MRIYVTRHVAQLWHLCFRIRWEDQLATHFNGMTARRGSQTESTPCSLFQTAWVCMACDCWLCPLKSACEPPTHGPRSWRCIACAFFLLADSETSWRAGSCMLRTRSTGPSSTPSPQCPQAWTCHAVGCLPRRLAGFTELKCFARFRWSMLHAPGISAHPSV